MASVKTLDHVQSVQAKKDENTIAAIVEIILDLESLYLENFRNGLSELDWDVIKRCKTALSVQLRDLSFFNLYIDLGILQFIEDDKSKFSTIKEIPRIKLSFNPRTIEHAQESVEQVEKDNNYSEITIENINQQLISIEITPIDDVRKKYVNSMDGFTFTLKFAENIKAEDFFEKFDAFNEEVKNLTLEELMIAQQFTDLFKVDYTNPFWYEKSKSIKDQNIIITLRNIETLSPFYYFNTILLNLRNTISQNLKVNDSEKNKSIKIFLSYNSINQSHIACSLNLEL